MGELYSQLGMVYKGHFMGNKFDGFGRLEYSDGSVFEGRFKQGVRQGKGVFYDVKGKILFDGVWKDDEFCG